MAWTEKKGSGGSGKNITKWENAGTELIGVFLGVTVNHDKKTGKEFENIRVRQDGGIEMEASYTSDLKDKLADVKPGTRVHIVYTGQVQTNSGRRVKKFRILVDDGAGGAVSTAQAPSFPSESEYEQLAAKLQKSDPKGAPGILAALKQLFKDEGARTQALREAVGRIAADEVPF